MFNDDVDVRFVIVEALLCIIIISCSLYLIAPLSHTKFHTSNIKMFCINQSRQWMVFNDVMDDR